MCNKQGTRIGNDRKRSKKIEKDRKKTWVIDHRCSSLCLSRCVSGVNDVKVNLFGVEEEEDEEDDLVVVATKEELAETEEEREGKEETGDKEETRDKEETGDKEEKEEHPTTTDTTTVLPTATTTTTTPSKRVHFAMNEKDSTTTTTRAMFDQIQLATEVLAHAVSEDVTGSSAIAGTGNTFRYWDNTGVKGCRY